MTIEELFLKSVEMQILREKAFSDDYEIKISALDDLEKKVNDGSYKSRMTSRWSSSSNTSPSRARGTSRAERPRR